MKKQIVELQVKYAENAQGNVLGCPICNFEYNHIDGVETQKGNDKYETEYESVCRGDALIIKMHCENGHNYRIVFGAHKGWMYLFAVKGKS